MSHVIWGEAHLVIWDDHGLGLYRSPLDGSMAFNVLKNNLFKKKEENVCGHYSLATCGNHNVDASSVVRSLRSRERFCMKCFHLNSIFIMVTFRFM